MIIITTVLIIINENIRGISVGTQTYTVMDKFALGEKDRRPTIKASDTMTVTVWDRKCSEREL